MAITLEPVAGFSALVRDGYDAQLGWLDASDHEIGKALQDIDAASGVSAAPGTAAEWQAPCALENGRKLSQEGLA